MEFIVGSALLLVVIAALLALLVYLNRNDINVEPPRPRGIWR